VSPEPPPHFQLRELSDFVQAKFAAAKKEKKSYPPQLKAYKVALVN
jgi:hypothetical protein